MNTDKYNLICEIFRFQTNTNKPMTWKYLIDILKYFYQESDINKDTKFIAKEHHHFTSIHFYPIIANMNGSDVLIPYLEHMHNYSKFQLKSTNFYFKELKQLHKKYGNKYKHALSYFQFLQLTKNKNLKGAVSILDIWSLDEKRVLSDFIHISNQVDQPLALLEDEMDEIMKHPSLTKMQKKEKSDEMMEEISDLYDKVKNFKIPRTVGDGDYYLSSVDHPSFHIYEF